MSDTNSTPQSSQPLAPQPQSQNRKQDTILCHCCRCDREWLSTDDVLYICGSSDVELTPSWQLHC